MKIRPAQLADSDAISAIHCSNIEHWQVWDSAGNSRPAHYADLTPYQRWLHGGPWLDPGTCARHLDRLLSGGGLALVAEAKGQVVAEAELHLADEPPPYGRNLNLSTLYVHRHHQRQGLGSALLQQAQAIAQDQRCDTFTVANVEAPGFYKKHGLQLAERWMTLRVGVGQPGAGQPLVPTYTAEPLPDDGYDSVRGWALPIGRYQNALHDWERTRPDAGPDFVEWGSLKLERQRIRIGQHLACAIFEEDPDHPAIANLFLFTPPDPNTASLDRGLGDVFSAARDLAARLGFSHLHCFVRSDLKLPDAVPPTISSSYGGKPSPLRKFLL